MEYSIDHLNSHPDLIPEVSRCFFDEWSHQFPDKTIADVELSVKRRIHTDRVPMALVAVDADGGLLGTVSLIENDLESRPQFSPWLASLYVKPESRGKGLGSILVKEILLKASDAGIRNIYLYTETAERYYTEMGWTICEKFFLHGTNVTIMKRELDPHDGCRQ